MADYPEFAHLGSDSIGDIERIIASRINYNEQFIEFMQDSSIPCIEKLAAMNPIVPTEILQQISALDSSEINGVLSSYAQSARVDIEELYKPLLAKLRACSSSGKQLDLDILYVTAILEGNYDQQNLDRNERVVARTVARTSKKIKETKRPITATGSSSLINSATGNFDINEAIFIGEIAEILEPKASKTVRKLLREIKRKKAGIVSKENLVAAIHSTVMKGLEALQADLKAELVQLISETRAKQDNPTVADCNLLWREISVLCAALKKDPPQLAQPTLVTKDTALGTIPCIDFSLKYEASLAKLVSFRMAEAKLLELRQKMHDLALEATPTVRTAPAKTRKGRKETGSPPYLSAVVAAEDDKDELPPVELPCAAVAVVAASSSPSLSPLLLPEEKDKAQEGASFPLPPSPLLEDADLPEEEDDLWSDHRLPPEAHYLMAREFDMACRSQAPTEEEVPHLTPMAASLVRLREAERALLHKVMGHQATETPAPVCWRDIEEMASILSIRLEPCRGSASGSAFQLFFPRLTYYVVNPEKVPSMVKATPHKPHVGGKPLDRFSLSLVRKALVESGYEQALVAAEEFLTVTVGSSSPVMAIPSFPS